jgi:ABC-type lipoprotein export system ATPase subunit
LLHRIVSEQRTTILMATHSVEAAGIADTVVHLRDGSVAEIRQSLKAV